MGKVGEPPNPSPPSFLGSCRFWSVLVFVVLCSGQALFVYFDRHYQLQLAQHCNGLLEKQQHNSTPVVANIRVSRQGQKSLLPHTNVTQAKETLKCPPPAPTPKCPPVPELKCPKPPPSPPTPKCPPVPEIKCPELPPPSPSVVKKENYYTPRKATENEFDGVRARAFSSWPQGKPLPCYPASENWGSQNILSRPTDEGFLFLKPYKTGSSTAVGVHLRVSRNLARRQNKTLCDMRFDHNLASHLFPQRKRERSFLWTIARDPTNRIVSLFFHFKVSRHKLEPSQKNFRELFQGGDVSNIVNYYPYAFSPTPIKKGDDFAAKANKIMDYYDFVAVTERMDESMVVLSMLMGVPVGDVLYLKAKGHGGYDDGGGRDKRICTYIWPSFVTDEMKEYFMTDEYQEFVRWDRAIHLAANRSLDLTIDRLGRDKFERKLALYNQAKNEAHDRCLEHTTFPCTKDGAFHPRNDCMWTDSSCNNECLDLVASDLGI